MLLLETPNPMSAQGRRTSYLNGGSFLNCSLALRFKFLCKSGADEVTLSSFETLDGSPGVRSVLSIV